MVLDPYCPSTEDAESTTAARTPPASPQRREKIAHINVEQKVASVPGPPNQRKKNVPGPPGLPKNPRASGAQDRTQKNVPDVVFSDSDSDAGDSKETQYAEITKDLFHFIDDDFKGVINAHNFENASVKLGWGLSIKRIPAVLKDMSASVGEMSAVDLPTFTRWCTQKSLIAISFLDKFTEFTRNSESQDIYHFVTESNDFDLAALIALYNSLGITIKESTARHVFRHINNGLVDTVSFADFRQWYYRFDSWAERLGSAYKLFALKESSTQLFNILDHDRSGSVGKEKLLRVSEILSVPMDEIQASAIIAEISKNKTVDMKDWYQWVVQKGPLARHYVHAIRLHKLKEEEAQQQSAKISRINFELEEERRMGEEKNAMWVRRMAMDFSKQTWPKSLDGFLQLGSALKDAMAWEDPTYRNKPKKMRKKRQVICRSILIKAVRRFLNETDKAHALVETSEFYDAENEDYWNWKMKEEAKIIKQSILLCISPENCKRIIRNGTRCINDYNIYLESVNRKVRSRMLRNPIDGRQQALARVRETVIKARLQNVELAQTTARKQAEREANKKPTRYYERIAKKRLLEANLGLVLDEIIVIESKLEPQRVKSIRVTFGEFGRDSTVLSDRRAYLKGLYAELADQKADRHNQMNCKASQSCVDAKRRVSELAKKKVMVSPTNAFHGKVLRKVLHGIEKVRKQTIKSQPRVILAPLE